MTADIRGDVVRLLLDVDHSTVHVDPDLTPDTVAAGLYRAHRVARHEDGQPLTEAEAVLAATVSGAELDYVALLMRLHSDAVSAAQADHQRITEIMKPYPRDMATRDLLEQLPADQQAELEILIDRVSNANGRLARPQAEETTHYDSYRRALAELDS
jgi:hypothetical protein